MGRTLKYRGKRSIMFNIMSTPNTAPLMTLEIMNPYLRQMAQFKARNVRSLNEGRGEANVGGGGGLRVLLGIVQGGMRPRVYVQNGWIRRGRGGKGRAAGDGKTV